MTGRRGYQVGAAWSRTGDYTGTLEDVSGYVAKDTDVTVSWGRTEPRATADTAAGKMTVKLLNHGRQFSPENTASPITGRIVPGTPVRLAIEDPATPTPPDPTQPTPGGLPKAATLTETFRGSTVNTGKWPNSAGASVAGWRGRLTMPGNTTTIVQWSTENNRYDLTSSYYGVEVAQLPSNTASVGIYAVASLSPTENRISIIKEGTNLICRMVQGGVLTPDTVITFDRMNHRWWRLRHDGTNVLWQTSTNGIVWTTRRTSTTSIDLTSVFFTMEGNWQGTVGVGRLEFANVNTVPVTALTYSPPAYHVGVLRTIDDFNTDKADDHYAGGDRIGQYEVFWTRAEGAANGTFDSTYATQVATETARIRATGLKLTLGMGINFPPTWTNTIANYRFVNESGGFSSQLNIIFNQLVRTQVEQYYDWIGTVVGWNNVWSVRIISGDNELLYPTTAGWWAYDANAQGTGTDRPATVAPCPYPGWVPGSTTITVAQAEEWYSWYIDSLVDVANWQMRYLRETFGYTGWFEILTPGSGQRPSLLATEIANRLSPADFTTKVGAVWHEVYKRITDRHGVVAYCSSMADNSGTIPNDVPTATDVNTDILSSTANGWSAYRWVVRCANEFGIPNGGENPGRGGVADSYYQDTTSSGLMAKTLAQSAGGKALSTYWAHGDQLWGNSTLTFANWTAKVAALNTSGPGTPPNPPS